MSARPEANDPGQARVGRPPRISRAAIADAANELGLDGLTLRAVAAHLGVSIAALYHHVSSKDELLRLAAEASARAVPIPKDIGQHWALWLYEWASYNRAAFVSEPAMLLQYMEGAITAEAIAENIDRALGLLVRQGFTSAQATAAFELIGSYSVGSAVNVIRQRQVRTNDQNSPARLLASLDEDDLPHYREFIRRATTNPDERFHVQLVSVLGSIAVDIGGDTKKVRALLDDAHGAPSTGRRWGRQPRSV